MKIDQLPIALKRIRKACQDWPTPAVTQISRSGSPFRVLVSTMLSLRTRDEVTESASKALFALADDPEKMLRIPPGKIRRAIQKVAFFRNKQRSLLAMCRILVKDYDGQAPDSLDELLTLPGVGRKTANLTLTLGFNKPGICVDTHVHRICNRWGLVHTRTADETEMELRNCLPKRYWKGLNNLLVAFGQNCCRPQSPFCSECRVEEFCIKLGVTKTR